MKKSLVLEGGGMRALFTAAVLDTLTEENITFDSIISVSSGALFGLDYKSRQIGRSLRYNMKYGKDPRCAGIRSYITTKNFINKEFCYRVIPEELDPFDKKTFAENPMEYHVVCTDILTGKPYYYQLLNGDRTDFEKVHASSALPLIATIVDIDDKRFLDGGMGDPIPFRYAFRNLGADKVFVILTQPKGFVKKSEKALPLIELVYRKYPNLLAAIRTRHIRYDTAVKEIYRLQAAGKIFVIQPEESLNISRTNMDPKELQRVYNEGRIAAKKHLYELKKFFEIE